MFAFLSKKNIDIHLPELFEYNLKKTQLISCKEISFEILQ